MTYADKLRNEIAKILSFAEEERLVSVVIKARNLHEVVIGPIRDGKHQIHNCCRVMKEYEQDQDRILISPPSGESTTLEIQYDFPRQ
jgi:hypothetical protein